jgi:hypothetical protein
MLRKNNIKIFDHIFPHKFTLKFLRDHSLTPCIQDVSEIRVLISIRSRGCEMKRFLYLIFYEKALQIDLKFGKN